VGAVEQGQQLVQAAHGLVGTGRSQTRSVEQDAGKARLQGAYHVGWQAVAYM
jgi:hypothetical protein